jgi:hypothetical protein
MTEPIDCYYREKGDDTQCSRQRRAASKPSPTIGNEMTSHPWDKSTLDKAQQPVAEVPGTARSGARLTEPRP